MAILYIKSLHIIFVVSWFAGLFYIVRLFIYHREALDKKEPELSILTGQYKKMEKLLWNAITAPAMILTLATGSIMLYLTPYYLNQPWMIAKICFVSGLTTYHFLCRKILLNLKDNICKYSSFQLRLWNEVATVFLVSIVFLVVLRNTISLVWGLIGFITFAILIMSIVKLIKNIQNKK